MSNWDSFKVLYANRWMLSKRNAELVGALIIMLLLSLNSSQTLFERQSTQTSFTDVNMLFNNTAAKPITNWFTLAVPEKQSVQTPLISMGDFLQKSAYGGQNLSSFTSVSVPYDETVVEAG